MSYVGSTLGTLISFLIVLSIVVVIHELGHFLSAKLFKIRIDTFSLGFGKRLFGWTRGGTDYRLSAIPLGGFVKLAGELSEEATGKPDEFLSHPRWQRIIVYVMGPVMNALLAIVLFSTIYMTGVNVPSYPDQNPIVGYVEKGSPAERAGFVVGDLIVHIDGKKVSTWNDVDITIGTSPNHSMIIDVQRGARLLPLSMTTESRTRYSVGYAGFTYVIEPVVETISKGMPAERAGLQKGDRIVTINNIPIRSFQEASVIIRSNPGKEIELTFDRKGRLMTKRLTTANQKGIGFIGFSPHQDTIMRSYPFFMAIRESVKQCWSMSTLILEILKKYVIREMPLSSLSGPLDIARMSYTTALSGFSTFVAFLAAISLQLGIINLLPIPILDGGHVLLLAVESIARRDLHMKIKERVLQVGFVLLILLMAFVVVNDVVKTLPDSVYKYVPWRN